MISLAKSSIATHFFPYLFKVDAFARESFRDFWFFDDYSAGETPDPIPTSEVKACSADDSAFFECVKVGRCREPLKEPPSQDEALFLYAIFGLPPES